MVFQIIFFFLAHERARWKMKPVIIEISMNQRKLFNRMVHRRHTRKIPCISDIPRYSIHTAWLWVVRALTVIRPYFLPDYHFENAKSWKAEMPSTFFKPNKSFLWHNEMYQGSRFVVFFLSSNTIHKHSSSHTADSTHKYSIILLCAY